jgi:hypothetical protein
MAEPEQPSDDEIYAWLSGSDAQVEQALRMIHLRFSRLIGAVALRTYPAFSADDVGTVLDDTLMAIWLRARNTDADAPDDLGRLLCGIARNKSHDLHRLWDRLRRGEVSAETDHLLLQSRDESLTSPWEDEVRQDLLREFEAEVATMAAGQRAVGELMVTGLRGDGEYPSNEMILHALRARGETTLTLEAVRTRRREVKAKLEKVVAKYERASTARTCGTAG